MLATVFEVPLSGHWPRLQHPEEWALGGPSLRNEP